MKVVFIETGEVKEVSAGHAVNYLIPGKLALPATDSLLKSVALDKERARKRIEENKRQAQEKKHILESGHLLIHQRANEEGKLFGGIGERELKKYIEKKKKISVPASGIKINGKIKALGDYEVSVDIGSGEKANLKVFIQKEESSNES